MEHRASVARDRGLARIRRAGARGGRPHRDEVAHERLRRRVGTRLRPHDRPPGLAAIGRVRVRSQRDAARGNAGVPVGRRGCRGADAVALGRRDADPDLGRPALGGRHRRPRDTPGLGQRGSRRRARGRLGSSAADDRRGGHVHCERRARPRRQPTTCTGPSSSSVPVTLLVLLFAFGSLVAALVPVAARPHRGRSRLRPARTDQPGLRARPEREDGRAPDRDGRRRGLRALLRRALARGAQPRRRRRTKRSSARRAPPGARCSSPGRS